MISDLNKTEIQKFIQDHLYDDPASLMLKAGSYPLIPMREVVEQIQSKRKAKNKLPEWFAASGVIYPPTLSLEQCSSEATGRYKASLIHGLSIADLTGGFGVDSYYLSLNFQEAHYIERAKELVDLATHNFGKLGADHIQCHNMDGLEFLEKVDERLMMVYLDPARRDPNNKKVVSFSECEPDVVTNLPLLTGKAVSVMIKASPMLDIKLAIEELGGVQEVHVVADHNEVKELLFIKTERSSHNPDIICVNLTGKDLMPYAFDYDTEKSLVAQYDTIDEYLYEPNAAILKGGAFKSVGVGHGLKKLQPNSHFYTSDKRWDHFPGRIFQVTDKLSMNKKQLRKKLPEMKANITVRNFPMTVDQIRKKTGLKEGGENYIVATQDTNGPIMLLCNRL